MLDPSLVARLRVKGPGYAIHVDDGVPRVYELDHNNETAVCGWSEVDWDLSDEEIAEWIDGRECE